MKRLIITIAVCAAVLIAIAIIVNISRNREIKIEDYDLFSILQYNMGLDNYKTVDWFQADGYESMYTKGEKNKYVKKMVMYWFLITRMRGFII
ncbi:MAG: hypothetical protein IKV94_03150 [Clostridia bacterium]|nr:hypothetical protein [Clostridia bacterium]